jgi:hypothetical protein
MTGDDEHEAEQAEDEIREAEEHGEVAAEADDDVHAQAEEQPQPDEPVGDAPDELRESLATMREEADRIAGLGTGQEQVEAAEQFAEDAGRLDEQIGSSARAADDERRS